jgi:hypothetical protein
MAFHFSVEKGCIQSGCVNSQTTVQNSLWYGGTEQPFWPKKTKNEKTNFQTNMSDSNRQVGQVDLTCTSYTLTIHLKHSNTYTTM